MIRTYKDAVKFLESYIPSPNKKFPGQLGLDRMKYLCKLLGNPHLAYKTIHVGGTSGKGSTATIIASILATKYKVGLYTSPHLEKINERIEIFSNIKIQNSKYKSKSQKLKVTDGDIPDEELVELINEIRPRIEMVEKSQYGKPTYFEITTAMAFLYFAKKKVNFAVIEVGMGGRFDGTNVIKPLVAVLTNVGLDHTEILGDSVEKIALDKAGIIKEGIQVVTGVSQQSVIDIVNAKCKMQNAKLSLLIPSPRGSPYKPATSEVSLGYFSYRVKKLTPKGSVFNYFGNQTLKNVHLSLLGQHQVENAAIALRAIEIQNPKSKIQNLDIRKGLEEVFIPGRLEIIKIDPIVLLDGAHNPDKIKALVDSIKTIFPDKRIKIILAIKKDKNAKDMIAQLLQLADHMILTQYRLKTDLGDTKSYTSKELKEIISRGPLAISARGPLIKLIKNPLHALKEAIREAKKDDLILVTGSLYLIGEIRKKLKVQNPNFKLSSKD